MQFQPDLECMMNFAELSDYRAWAIVLNWNQPAMTLKCVQALLAQTAPLRIVVVDNGSIPSNREGLRNGLPDCCEYLQNATNLGFAGGMNVGIRQALQKGAEFVWLMNNDAFPEADCLAKLIETLQKDHKLAAVSPTLYGTDGSEQHAGGQVRWLEAKHQLLYSAEMASPLSFGCWLTGTALLIRYEALRSSGGFDERFFAYWEEVDLLTRLAKNGWYFMSVPAARCLHLGSASTGGGDSPMAVRMLTRNAWLFLRKHVSPSLRTAALIGFVASALETAGIADSRGRRSQADAALSGLFDALTAQFGPPQTGSTVHGSKRMILWRWWRSVQVLRAIGAFLSRRHASTDPLHKFIDQIGVGQIAKSTELKSVLLGTMR